MKFDSLFDKRYFLHKVTGVEDKVLLHTLKEDKSLEIEDKIYFKLTDDRESFIGELKLHSGGKTFFKEMCDADILTVENIPALTATLTHLSIGLKDRFSIRNINTVQCDSYMVLKGEINSMIDTIIETGDANNTLKKELI